MKTMKPIKLRVCQPSTKLMKKNKLFLLGEGFPWYIYGDGIGKDKGGFKQRGYFGLHLSDGPNRQEGRKSVELKTRWGAYQKVRIWIEKA